MLRHLGFVQQHLFTLDRQVRPGFAMIWQNCRQELVLVPVSKAVEG